MANNKVTNKSFYWCFSIFVLILFMTTASTGQAAIKNPAVALTSDANGDGIAGIGDTITLTCRSTTNDATIYVTSLPSLGFTQLPLVDIGNGLYSAIYTVSAGNVNSQIQFIFDDNSGSTQSVTTGFVLNSKRPGIPAVPGTVKGSGIIVPCGINSPDSGGPTG